MASWRHRADVRPASSSCSRVLEGTVIAPIVGLSGAGWVAWRKLGSLRLAQAGQRLLLTQATSHPAPGCRLNIPDYFTIISHPMDLATIAKKLENNPRRNIVRRYQTPLELRDDVRLVGAGMFEWGLCW